MPKVKVPGATRAGNEAADRIARAYLVGVFSAPPTLPAPSTTTSGEPSLDLLKFADAHQTSLVKDDDKGHAVQVVNTIFSARSFTNRKDLYYVQQEAAVQGPPSSPSAGARVVNAMLDPIKPR